MKYGTSRLAVTLGSFLTVLAVARGSTATHARAGALEYVEGNAFVNGKTVQGNADQLPILDDGSALRTGKGHAEMLLTPGVFLRLDAMTEVRLVSASLTDTRIRLVRGAAMLEVDDLHKDNRIRVQVGGDTARVLKTGLYRFQADPAVVEVLKGRVEVSDGDRHVKAGVHREASLPALTVNKFKAADDDLSRWSRLRSEYEAEASVASAQYVFDRGLPWGYADWFWNPWFDAWTWLPASGFWMNPYGFGYWSPLLVYDYFPTRYYGYRRYGFTPGVRSFSPSGLNLQRGPQVSTANRMYGANGRASWPRGAGLGNTMPPRPSFSGGRFGGGGASRGGFGGRR